MLLKPDRRAELRGSVKLLQGTEHRSHYPVELRITDGKCTYLPRDRDCMMLVSTIYGLRLLLADEKGLVVKMTFYLPNFG